MAEKEADSSEVKEEREDPIGAEEERRMEWGDLVSPTESGDITEGRTDSSQLSAQTTDDTSGIDVATGSMTSPSEASAVAMAAAAAETRPLSAIAESLSPVPAAESEATTSSADVAESRSPERQRTKSVTDKFINFVSPGKKSDKGLAIPKERSQTLWGRIKFRISPRESMATSAERSEPIGEAAASMPDDETLPFERTPERKSWGSKLRAPIQTLKGYFGRSRSESKPLVDQEDAATRSSTSNEKSDRGVPDFVVETTERHWTDPYDDSRPSVTTVTTQKSDIPSTFSSSDVFLADCTKTSEVENTPEEAAAAAGSVTGSIDEEIPELQLDETAQMAEGGPAERKEHSTEETKTKGGSKGWHFWKKN